ncbi:MAG: ABC transporter permease [Alphaproteobacteria bacterium]|nr:ABC transporter permease [Alphaproteobacteria bacterium]
MVGGTPRGAIVIGAILAIAVAIFMLAPLVVVVVSSFSASEFLVFPPRGWSLRWYEEILRSRVYLDAAWFSLKLALVVTALALALGAGAAIAITRHAVPGSEVLQGFFLSPLVIPTILLGIGLLMASSRWAGGPSFWTLAAGHVVVTLPYVVRTVAATLARSDRSLEEAARVMGAPWWRRYWHVVLPQARPGLAAGAFFAFNVSFDEAVVALFLRAPGVETLPLLIYSKLEFSPDPSVAAAASLMILLTVVLMIALDRAVGLDRVAA